MRRAETADLFVVAGDGGSLACALVVLVAGA